MWLAHRQVSHFSIFFIHVKSPALIFYLLDSCVGCQRVTGPRDQCGLSTCTEALTLATWEMMVVPRHGVLKTWRTFHREKSGATVGVFYWVISLKWRTPTLWLRGEVTTACTVDGDGCIKSSNNKYSSASLYLIIILCCCDVSQHVWNFEWEAGWHGWVYLCFKALCCACGSERWWKRQGASGYFWALANRIGEIINCEGGHSGVYYANLISRAYII